MLEFRRYFINVCLWGQEKGCLGNLELQGLSIALRSKKGNGQRACEQSLRCRGHGAGTREHRCWKCWTERWSWQRPRARRSSPGGGASERSGRRGEEMLVSEEAIGEARCPSSTLLPGQPRKPARAGRGGGDSGSSSPGPQRAGSGEGVGGTAPHHSCRYGPSFPLPPPLHRPGLGHPHILSPPWHRHRDRDRASRHHRCRSLAGEGARPPGPLPH